MRPLKKSAYRAAIAALLAVEEEVAEVELAEVVRELNFEHVLKRSRRSHLKFFCPSLHPFFQSMPSPPLLLFGVESQAAHTSSPPRSGRPSLSQCGRRRRRRRE